MTIHGLVLADDLIFFSRIAGAAQAAGLNVRQSRTVAELIRMAKEQAPGGVIIDLNTPNLDLLSLIKELRAVCPVMPQVIGYGSHVQTEILRQARLARCNRVLPRTQFVEELEREILNWLTPPSA